MTQDTSVESIDIFDPVEDKRDPHHAHILQTFADVQLAISEQEANTDKYFFNHAEFIDALNFVTSDQLSVLKEEKLSPSEWAKRFNRWFVFCDAIVNMGVACVYSKDALAKEDYETVFKDLRINAVFETTFLKPRGLRVIFTHKSQEVRDNYPWLAMPCLLITDNEGVEHQIAITPSPYATVWWLEILAGFHASYNWNRDTSEFPLEDEDNPFHDSLSFGELDADDEE